MSHSFRARRPALFVALLAASLAAPGAVAVEDVGWPRELVHEKGTVVFYQPQIETFENDDLTARAAFSVTTPDQPEPIFGVLWSTARVSTDRDNRTVDVLDLDVTDVRFPDVTDEQAQAFAEFVESETEDWQLTISLDRVLANMAVVEQERLASENLKVDPPVILYADSPSVLITIDGEPRFATLPDDDSLKRVANTPYKILLETKKDKRTYWLDGGTNWYTAEKIEGPWTVDTKPPKRIRNQRTEDEEKAAAEAAAEAKAEGIDQAPRVIVATRPTELIVTDGAAEYVPIEDTELLYASNTDSDLLKDVQTQQNFILLSGRWYTSKTLDGPWTYVASDALPEDLAKIPPESEKGDLLAFVAGTEQAREAVMDNQIPQTAAVQRGRGDIVVQYDGEPQFKPIDGTKMQYAVNTASAVLLIDGKYWVCEKAVWYVGDTPNGPWQVATYRPADVDEIPPSNPHYNVKYVYVYDSTPEIVYTGYTPGYTGSYHYHGCIVYGTGWYYYPWYGRYYYPYHATWGFSVRWNPWYGWGFGVSWSNGPFTISIGFGGGYYGGWWGPRGYAYRPVYRPGYPAYRPPYRPGYPGYRPPGSTRPPTAQPMPSTRPAAGTGQANLYNRADQTARVADRSGGGRQPGVATGDRANNIYAGQDGNVYRRNQDGSWQQRSGNGWKPADPGAGTGTRPSQPSTRPSQPSTRPSQPSTRPSQPSTRPSQPSSRPSTGSLNRDHSARQRGSTRTNNYNRSRGSYGGARGGGRRR
jgi:hypothetical protein